MENNILFLLTPKSKVAYVLDTYSIRQALEKMDYHHFTAIPILNRDGRYVGTITEGDLLWYIKDQHQLNYSTAEKTKLSSLKLRRTYEPVTVDVQPQALFDVAIKQNFVPVLDDNGFFIGIVTRKTLLEALLKEVSVGSKRQ